jgi:hypothetical protein
MSLQKFQLARMSAGLPRFSPAVMTGAPYVAPDVWVGDNLDITAAPTAAGYPIPSPLYTLTAQVAGVSKGDATTYTVASPDVGSPVIVTQASLNSQGLASATSTAVTPVPVQRAWDLGLMGGNCANPTYFSVLQFVNNAGQCGRAFQAYSSSGNPSANYTLGYDSNGWPLGTFSFVLTAQVGGLDGQLPAGTYQCSFRGSGQVTNIVPSACAGCTVSGISHDVDGVTTHFQLVIPFASNVVLSFDGGIQYLDVPRDGVTPTWGGPEFWPTNLAFFAQFSVLRTMDLCQPNGNTESVWNDRNTLRPEYGPLQPGNSWSWERIARFIKAVVQYPGSRVQEVWINPPGNTDTSQANASNYAYQLATLLNTQLSGVSVKIVVEWGNEPWNNAFLLVASNRIQAQAEAKMLTGYPLGAGVLLNQISSIASNGDGTATVTLSSPLNAIPQQDGSTFAITNGMQMVMNHQTQNTTWGAGSITPDPNNTVDGTVVAATVTVPSPTGFTFTYPTNGTPAGGATVGAPSGSNQYAFFFNLTSTLVKDGITLNLFSIGAKLQARRAYQAWQKWTSVRSSDNMFLGLQQYGGNGFGIVNSSPVEFPYSKYIGGGSNAWCLGAAVAPYVKATGLAFTGVGTAGGTTITGVPWASTALVGDQINVGGAGTSGATLSTTVAAGSAGTTLVIADTIITTVTPANSVISYVACPSATFVGSISGTTLTVTSMTSGTIRQGMQFNGTPATIAFGTRIGTQLTGTAGGAGTYQVSVSQTIGSATMVAAQTDGLVNAINGSLGSFAASLASHVYTCKRWGWRAMVYEGGPDTQAFPTQQVAIHTNPAMQTVMTGLLDAWFNQDGKEFCFYWIAPSVFSNLAQGGWAALQSYSDTSSPKYAGVVGYATRVLSMQNSIGAPGTWGPSGSPGAYVQSTTQEQLSLSFNAVSGMMYASGNTAHRTLGVPFQLPRGRRKKLQVLCTDSVAGTLGDVYVDGAMVGTITLPNNGSGASNGTTPTAATLALGELSRGAHNIVIDFPIGRGTNIGIFSITLVSY